MKYWRKSVKNYCQWADLFTARPSPGRRWFQPDTSSGIYKVRPTRGSK